MAHFQFIILSLIISSSIYSQELFKTTSWIYKYEEDEVVNQAKELCYEKKYDEALAILNTIELDKTSDPAGFLYYKAICEYTLLMKDKCILTLNTLLENESKLPIRYLATAKLTLDDIQRLEEDSLDEVEKLMRDVTRRLDFGRAGKVVRNQEQLIVDKLDKLIKQTEQDIKDAQESASQSQGKGKGVPMDQGTPMEDSEIAGGKGSGDVDQKKLENGNWGNLPPKQRQEALQRLVEELPSHYREVIEGYFRKLAKEKQ